jgi:hypothetical protein
MPSVTMARKHVESRAFILRVHGSTMMNVIGSDETSAKVDMALTWFNTLHRRPPAMDTIRRPEAHVTPGHVLTSSPVIESVSPDPLIVVHCN